MTPDHIRQLLTQTGLTQAGLASALNETDPSMRTTQSGLTRWLMDRDNPNARTPDDRSTAVLVQYWLHIGYPCTVTLIDGSGADAQLTTDHAASSYGQPVLMIDGVPYGSDDVDTVVLPDAPDGINAATLRAGYRIWSGVS